MRKKALQLLLILVLAGVAATGQEVWMNREGKVSYVTTQNIYVKFEKTGDIKPGDTLFREEDGRFIPAMVVKEISSISCVCTPVPGVKTAVGETFLARIPEKRPETQAESQPSPAGIAEPAKSDTTTAKPQAARKPVQLIHGHAGIASFLNFSDATANSQRMKYTVAFGMDHIGGSDLSLETYLTFVHKLGAWDAIKEDVFNGLKVYSLAFNYRFNDHHRVWLGRKINPRISSIGAMDGAQYEFSKGGFTIGALAGFRPDNQNYSFDPDLFELGTYIAHDYKGKNGLMQSTLAFFNQLNSGMTDRRFFYLQHSNALVKNLWFFGSAEVDLYQMKMNPVDTVQKDTTYESSNSPSLSNLYLSLRYRPFRQLSLSVSYSARQNVIYYETYKDYLAQLLEQATVQGLVFSANYQPWKRLTVGTTLTWRDSKNDLRPTRNLYGFLSWNNIPVLGLSATGSFMLLETAYLDGQVYSLGLTRDFLKGRLTGGLGYRYVVYTFVNDAPELRQNMAEVSLNWRIMKKLYLGTYYEGTFDQASLFNRLYLTLTQRF